MTTEGSGGDGEDDFREAEAEPLLEETADEDDALGVPAEDPVDSDADLEVDPTEELAESFPLEPLVRVVGSDGLPELVLQDDPGHVPPFKRETFVCMADLRSFCLRGHWGEVIATFDPSEVNQAPDGRYRAKTALVLKRTELLLKREIEAMVKAMEDRPLDTPGFIHARASGPPTPLEMLRQICCDSYVVDQRSSFPRHRHVSPDWVEVDPIRPQCRHLGRQLMQAKDIAKGSDADVAAGKALKGQIRLALCTARRTLTGAFMSVRDTEVFGCDLREPREPDGIAALDQFDESKLEQSARREYTKMFAEPEPEKKVV